MKTTAFTLKRVDLHKKTATWYSEYLQSDRWKKLRANIIAVRGPLCEICKERPHYSLHHETYARLFNELPKDVLLVCKECHKIGHENFDVPFMHLIYMDNLSRVKHTLAMPVVKNSNSKPRFR